MPRPSNKRERRSQIAEAMLRVMAADGYERASIASIARAADLASGLIHYHFRNKQEILLEVIALLHSRMQARYRARLAGLGEGAGPRERLFALVDAHVALGEDADERAVAAWVAIGAEAVTQARVREAYARVIGGVHAELAQLFAACLRERGRYAGDAAAIDAAAERHAAAILATIEGAYQLAATAPDTIPRGFAAPAIRQMIHGLLEAP